MHIGNKHYSYPILCSIAERSNYDADATFKLFYDDPVYDKNKGMFKLNNIGYELSDLSLKKLVDCNKAKIAIEVQCSAALYNKQFVLDVNNSGSSFSIEIPIIELHDKVEIMAYIYSTDRILGFSSELFSEAYKGKKFDIGKNYLLAYDGSYYFNVDVNNRYDKSVESIFEIVRNVSDFQEMKVSPDNDKIRIALSDKFYTYYDNTLKRIEEWNKIIFALILIPALSYSIDYVLQGIDDAVDIGIEEISSTFRWFSSLDIAYKKIYNTPLTLEAIHENGSLGLSQKLLGYPNTEALGILHDFAHNWNHDTYGGYDE